ncbi:MULTISPECIES: sulfate adenylyltransferase subunit CysN [unclassified Beijerinckia]|uniref:sulfate adenylyltransferase subunit CysN n=1 Tax=unclassified Beijerinckia TaxID=2638183 RepID=UPI000895BD59|nr:MULTISPECIES: sulfate adenylyltransferase subunit CysN [unclassified Beijerinckia]MDH7794357.1 bifunctional enzyme CysN/CysC [Beijerinckia sp. GAS462]SEB59807.1 bifunctional enzyme CysN/CysC/sulfate adenylyltransferase subunit 1 [Beijerinckia sp. 28-YEA-48]
MDALIDVRPRDENNLALAVSELPAQKSLLRFITCGSVDDGKSTLIGRILHDTGGVFDDQLETLENDSRKFGTQGARVDFALLVDGLSAEREQGITIDVAYRYFSTPRRSFIVADTPGHEQYTRNMATGASTAELAIILIDARKGVLPQTRRHSFIVSMLGVREIVVAINKMDLVAWSQEVYERIVADYREMAKHLGFTNVVFVPVSALEGDNVAAASQAMPWYRGVTLLGHLETVVPQVAAARDDGFAFPVQWVSRPNLDFRGYAGWLTRGQVAAGDDVVALPSGRRSQVQRIVTADGDLPTAVAGQAVTLTLVDEIDISRGDVLVSAAYAGKPRSELTAKLLWMSERSLADGSTYLLKVGTTTAQTKVNVSRTVDIHTYEEAATQRLNMNEIGIATLTLDRPIVVDDYRDDRELGGFILIDRWTNETMALGLVDSRLAAAPPVADGEAATTVSRSWLARTFDVRLPLRSQARRDLIRRSLIGHGPLSVLIGAVIFGLTGTVSVAVGVALIDLVARNLLAFYVAGAGQQVTDLSEVPSVNVDGDGI